MAGASLRYRNAFRAIQAILIHEWDPICHGDGLIPQDEYDSYIPAIYRLVVEGVDDLILAQHLEHLETDVMGISSGGKKNRIIAKRLREVIGELGI